MVGGKIKFPEDAPAVPIPSARGRYLSKYSIITDVAGSMNNPRPNPTIIHKNCQ